MKINVEKFLADVPSRLGFKPSTSQRDGLLFLLAKIQEDSQWTVLRQVAYFLSTIAWETGHTFQPIAEKRASKERQPKLRALQDAYWSTGFYGRGYVQITWRRNYDLAGKKLISDFFKGVPDALLMNPQLVMVPNIAYAIAARGMLEGWFTGKKLSDYLPDNAPGDYVRSRRVINGSDRAVEIAAIATSFELLLRASA